MRRALALAPERPAEAPEDAAPAGTLPEAAERPEQPLAAGDGASEAWPSAEADAREDLLRWDDCWTHRSGVTLTPREGEALARIAGGAWEVRADVAALLSVPRYGAGKDIHAAIHTVHAQLWEGRRKLR